MTNRHTSNQSNRVIVKSGSKFGWMYGVLVYCTKQGIKQERFSFVLFGMRNWKKSFLWRMKLFPQTGKTRNVQETLSALWLCASLIIINPEFIACHNLLQIASVCRSLSYILPQFPATSNNFPHFSSISNNFASLYHKKIRDISRSTRSTKWAKRETHRKPKKCNAFLHTFCVLLKNRNT